MILKNKILKVVQSACRLSILLLLFSCFLSFSNEKKHIDSSIDISLPMEVDVTLRINKIYNINSVDETYQVDGYLYYSWHDERFKFDAKSVLDGTKMYVNESAKAFMENEKRIPVFELINVQGEGETPNASIEIDSKGNFLYKERFFCSFSTDVNYKKFPFDTQSYLIVIEPFSYNIEEVVFKHPKLIIDSERDNCLGDDWKFLSQNASLTVKNYKPIDGDASSKKNMFSRVTYEVKAKRLSGYYKWQVLYPLLIIILASFLIFWIEDFGTQIGVGFTLMLTVVAFNFYSASILPKLPYNTFIEYVIIVGYIFILLAILAVIVNHRLDKFRNREKKDALLKHFRYSFPLVYGLIMIVLYVVLIK